MNKNYQLMMEEIINKIDTKKKPRLLLHACCAPCSSYVLEYLSKYFDITIYYYNPNIYPYKEFEKRTIELDKLVSTMPLDGKVNVVVEKYDYNEFKDKVKGHELDLEGQERCFICYNLRMEKAAKYAKDNNYDYFTTTLSISPYKNAEKLNEIGEKLEKKYKVEYLYADFKKKNGYKRSIELSKKYSLYRQDYCGCVYSKKNKKNKKKHKYFIPLLISIVLMLLIGLFSYLYIDGDIFKFNIHDIKSENLVDINKEKIDIDNNNANINEIYFYGRHFNINGNLNKDFEIIDSINLIFIGKKFQYSYNLNYDIIDNNINFYASKTLNEGLILDDMNIDKYDCYIEVNSNSNKKYYNLINDTNYSITSYITVTNNNFNKKLLFTKDYHKLKLDIMTTKEKYYDVVIDPGHGGNDEGACFNNICETDYTLELSNLLKEELIKKGYKATLTRDDDTYLAQYGIDGRIAKSYQSNAKLLISIHLNSTTVSFNGYEIYLSNNMNPSFATNIVNSFNKIGKLLPSNNTSFKIGDGIYTRTLSTSDIASINKNVPTPYSNVTTNTNYYFMIRETGGYMSGAYVDGANGKENKYRNSNVGLESYILELGYINNPNNVEIVNKYKQDYMKKLSEEIDKYFKNNKDA